MKNDVAVVGAGPGGAWAAYALARHGARVALIDPSHPREKACGGGVTGRALALVADAIDIEGLPARRIRSARFVGGATCEGAVVPLENCGEVDASCFTAFRARRGAPPHTVSSRLSRGLVVASRSDFDGLLLAAARDAGAEIVAARVTDVLADSGGFQLDVTPRSLHAAHVIGADGANSLVRRRLARPFGRAELSIATGYFAHGVTSDEIVVELVADPPGYMWSFPRPTHLAIGICAQADAGAIATALRARTAAWIRSTRLAGGARLESYAWPIPSLTARGLETLTVAGPGWFLVGDAGGLVDPITREGIYFALLSGQWAAEALLSGAADPSRCYAERVRDEIAPELARAARFKAGFFRPQFTRLMTDALHHSAGVRAVLADLVTGQQRYAGLQWRLAKTLEAKLAWRLLRS
jgi:geranylgeranyl reductase family protein